MKINIASPATGTQKIFEIEEEKKLVLLHEKRIAQDFEGEILGDDFKGYVFRITGGQDKQGFPMKQGVLTNSRVRLLLRRGDVGYQKWRGRKGERRRKSVRGCIVGGDIACLNCIIIHEGPDKIEGLNDHSIPRRLGPKRATKIRRLFNLTKEDDVRKFVIRRYLPPKENKKGKMRKGRSKAPKIQRLITPVTEERKRRRISMLRKRHAIAREERADFQKMLDKRRELSKRRRKSVQLRAIFKQKRRENRHLSCKKKNATKKAEKLAAKQKASKTAKKPAKPAASKAAAKPKK
jgi:small subunit ribosomal protein S6e